MVESAIARWHATRSDFPHLGRLYTKDEQQQRETLLDGYVDNLETELGRACQEECEREQTTQGLTAAVIELASYALDFKDTYFESLLRDAFTPIAADLAREARGLDPHISMVDILQAARNAWTACGLQLLLGKTVGLTPAIFGYSMLYPYTDNYLDDAAVPREAKFRFHDRFGRRLEGDSLDPESEREKNVWRLCGLIESQYPRASYPRVHDSLLAIYRAQQESIRQMNVTWQRGMDVLRLTVTKGGTSVLADAYLAAGSLTPSEAVFAFEWGVLLQLSDDLQDVHPDRERGSLTLFSQATGREPLDQLTNRTFRFGRDLMTQVPNLPNGTPVLQDLLTRSSRSLLIRSAANAAELYTSCYISKLEMHSPFRFAFLRNREERFARRSRSYDWLCGMILLNDGSRESEVHDDALE